MLLVAAAILSCAALWACPRLRRWWVSRKLAGPRGWPLLGNALDYIQGPEKAFSLLGRQFDEFGAVFRLWIGPQLVVCVAAAEDAQRLVAGPEVADRGGLFQDAFAGLAGVNLVSAQGETARTRRRLVAPAFHAARLGDYLDVFARNADEACARIAKIADGRDVDIKDQLSTGTLAAICETALGVHLNYDLEQWTRARDQLQMALTLVFRRVVNPWLLIGWIYSMTSEGKLAKEAKQTFVDIFRDAVSRKRQDKQPAAHGHKTARSFLDTALDNAGSAGNALTETETRDEFTGLALAGMETTANAMAYVLMLLAMHPDEQRRVVDEQREIFQSPNELTGSDSHLRAATSEDLGRMPVLDRVIKETLRLFPAALFVSRELPVDLTLADGVLVPAGATAYVSTYHLHRNADNFEQPTRFWPDRWLPENSVGRHAYAYLPFGTGVRKCVGSKYALLQMKATLSRVLREFRVECRHTMRGLERIEAAITAVSVLGYDVQLYAR